MVENIKKTLDVLPYPVILIDKDLTLNWVNNSGFIFFVGDVVGTGIGDIFINDDSITNSVKSTFAGSEGVTLNKHNTIIKNIGSSCLNITVSLIEDMVIICITCTKSGYSSLSGEMKQLVSMLAHEIKNPLSGIRGASQLLDTGRKGDLANLITQETDRITNLVNSLENLVEARDVKFSSVNIHQVLDKILALGDIGFAEHCKIEKDYDPSLPSIWGDEDKIIQIFINLIKNASEEIKGIDNGCIIIKTYYVSGASIIIDGKKYRALGVGIIDNGRGISADQHGQIFTPYKSNKKGGKGMGLSVVSTLVDASYGRIKFNTSEDGTTFSVILPIEA